SATEIPGAVDTASGGVDEGDEDWFSFAATGGTRYRLEVLSENGNCFNDYNPFYSTLEIYDTDGGTLLDSNAAHPFYDWWNGTACSGLMFTPQADGTYYFRVVPTYGDTLDPYYLLVRER